MSKTTNKFAPEDREVLGEHARDLRLQGDIPLRLRRKACRVLPLRDALVIGRWGDRQNAADRLDPRLHLLRSWSLRQTRRGSVLIVAAPAYLAARGRPEPPAQIVDHHCIQFYDAPNGRPFD